MKDGSDQETKRKFQRGKPWSGQELVSKGVTEIKNMTGTLGGQAHRQAWLLDDSRKEEMYNRRNLLLYVSN